MLRRQPEITLIWCLKLDFCNVKVRFRRARALLNLIMVQGAHEDVPLALKFDPSNDDVKELYKVEQICKPTCVNDPVGLEENGVDSPDELFTSFAVESLTLCTLAICLIPDSSSPTHSCNGALDEVIQVARNRDC